MTTRRPYRSARELTVVLGGKIAGTLTANRARASYLFTYDDAWRAAPDAYPLSLSIPLASRVHKGTQLAFYLRALLPDSEARLNVIANQHDVEPDDWFGLLAHIGEDCPGAVQFASPERVSALTGKGRGRTQWLNQHEVADLLRSLESDGEEAPSTIDIGRFSLPGALPKLALARDAENRKWGRPSGRAATTHILKPPLRGVPHHNENEHLCLELARKSGFAAPRSYLIRVEDQTAIAVERYDRRREGTRVIRLHQEDCSQALGANPRLKYASEGAPGIEEIVGLLRDHSSRGLEDVYQFLRAVALNWVIAGTDAHPRNYSLLIRAGADVELAPLYDLASALLLPTRTKVQDLAFPMKIAGRTRLGSIDATAWSELAKQLRLNSPRLLNEVASVAKGVSDAADNVANAGIVRGLDAGFCNRFADRIGARAEDCLAAING